MKTSTLCPWRLCRERAELTGTVLAVRDLLLARHTDNAQASLRTYHVSLPTLDVSDGEVVAVTGPSGCGKSTLIEALGLILQPASLSGYRLRAQELAPWLLADDARADRVRGHVRSQHLGFVPQTGGLLPYLNVQQNIELQARMLGLTVDPRWLDSMAQRLGLSGLLTRLPRELSVGQRQRTSFLRALAHQPDLLLADEPTAALDPEHAAQLFTVMLDLVRQAQIAAIVVTHEWALVDTLGLRRLRAEPRTAAHMEFVE